MLGMFYGASAFNQPIGLWNVSSVESMWIMFKTAASFDQPIGDWNVTKVTNVSEMFNGALNFNQNLGDWNISAMTSMENMFGSGNALSNSNKGEIHKSFSANPNWPYDWRQYVVIDNTNFQSAVNLWFDNQAEANATYDWNIHLHIKDSGMFQAFKVNKHILLIKIYVWDTSAF